MNKYLDKIAHCFVCAFLTLVLCQVLPPFMAFWIVCALGILKELFDKYIKKTFADWKDLLADLAGIATGLLATLL